MILIRYFLILAYLFLFCNAIQAKTVYAIVFNSQRYVLATEISVLNKSVTFRSIDTGFRYGVPKSFLWKVIEINDETRQTFINNPENFDACILRKREDIKKIDTEQIKYSDLLVWVNESCRYENPEKDDGGIYAGFFVSSKSQSANNNTSSSNEKVFIPSANRWQWAEGSSNGRGGQFTTAPTVSR